MSDLTDKKLERIIEVVGKINPDDVLHVMISHDPHCPAIETQSLLDCTCDPDIESIAVN